jgi:RNA polymerase sigma-70 factor (ECF subfamily)
MVAGGRPHALEQIYDRYSRLVFSLAVQMLGDRGTAEEITLDVFTQLWQKAESYQPGRASVKTWLTSIARHRAIDEIRRLDVRPEGDSISWDALQVEPASSSHPEAQAERALDHDRVRRALGSLPEEQRRALILAYFGGQTQREIAASLDIPLGTVKTRIRLGMQKLRRRLRG